MWWRRWRTVAVSGEEEEDGWLSLSGRRMDGLAAGRRRRRVVAVEEEEEDCGCQLEEEGRCQED